MDTGRSIFMNTEEGIQSEDLNTPLERKRKIRKDLFKTVATPSPTKRRLKSQSDYIERRQISSQNSTRGGTREEEVKVRLEEISVDYSP